MDGLLIEGILWKTFSISQHTSAPYLLGMDAHVFF